MNQTLCYLNNPKMEKQLISNLKGWPSEQNTVASESRCYSSSWLLRSSSFHTIFRPDLTLWQHCASCTYYLPTLRISTSDKVAETDHLLFYTACKRRLETPMISHPVLSGWHSCSLMQISAQQSIYRPTLNLKHRAQNKRSLYQVVPRQISTNSNVEPFSNRKLDFHLCFGNQGKVLQDLFASSTIFDQNESTVQKCLNPEDTWNHLNCPINLLLLLLRIIWKFM